MSMFHDEIDEVETRVTWKNKLNEFYSKGGIYEEVFKPHKISRETALLIWDQNTLRNAIYELQDILDG